MIIADSRIRAVESLLGRRQEMDDLRKIAVLNNMVETQMLDSMLNEQKIPHMMKTYRDSAYDGLFQVSKGWGHVEAPEKHRTEILAILDDLRTRTERNAE